MTRTAARLLALALLAMGATLPAQAAIPVYGVKVVHAYPHDPRAFTEGLFYQDGYLYESTGQLGESSVRKVELATGKVVQQKVVPPPYFGEGIVEWHGQIKQLTWRNQYGFVYDQATFKDAGGFSYDGEGWALTRDATHVYMSDGTPTIRILDPDTMQPVGKIDVTADGVPLANINELEWVKGEIYANVWLTSRIARIDPKSGKVVGWIELKGMFDYSRLGEPADDVPNGIAYDAERDRLFVTGKRWPKIFEIKLTK
jgi:glutaminyl-peptide cyclotransferase